MVQDKITHQIEGADTADTEQVADAPLHQASSSVSAKPSNSSSQFRPGQQ